MKYNDEKLSTSVKFGYGLGTVGDSIPYNLFFTYFLFFLTDVAGISPAVAGIISFLSICWDAITDPIVGYLSDKSNNPKGRRRPYIFLSIWPLALLVFFLFIPNDMTGGFQITYYVVSAILLWTFYTLYTVPWGALGAEITQDYNERNNLRMFVGVIAYVFVAVCNSGPMYVISLLLPLGFTIKQCWGIVGALGAILITVLGLISVRTTKGHEIDGDPNAPTEKASLRGFFIQYKELFGIRIFKILILTGLIYLIGFTIANATGVYLLTYCAGLTPGQQGTFWLIYTVVAMVSTPIPIITANKIGKKRALIAFSWVFVANAVAFYLIGIDTFTTVMLYFVLVAFSTSAFWGLFFSFVYDITEVDEYVNNKRREGGILAIAQFFQKFAAAIATSITGFLLSLFGYTGTGVESAETIRGILILSTLIPGAIMAASMVVFSRFPLNREKFDRVKDAIDCRNRGEDYPVEKIKDVL